MLTKYILQFFKRNATHFLFTCNVESRWKNCFTFRPYVTPVSEPCHSTVCPQVSTPPGWLPTDKIYPARASSAHSSLQRPTSLTITTHCWSCSGDNSWIMTSHTRPSVGVSSIGPPWVTTLSMGMNLQEKFRCVWPGQNTLDQSAVVSCAWELILLVAVVACLIRPVHKFHFRHVTHWTSKKWWPLASDSRSGRDIFDRTNTFFCRPEMICDLTRAVKFKYTDMCRLMTGIRSEKWVVRWFHHCVNVYLHKSI